jgi:glutaredoxin 3
MARVEIYTTMLCPYCWRAKKLLEERGAAFQEVDVMCDGGLRGGCDDLYALDRAGKLKSLLEQPALEQPAS